MGTPRASPKDRFGLDDFLGVETKKGETTLIRGRKSWRSCWVLSVALVLALLLDHLLNLYDKDMSFESDGRRHVRKLKLRKRLEDFVSA